MSNKSHRRRTRRLASALGAAVVLALAASSPALAADADGNHMLDPDGVRAGNTAASFGDGALDAQRWTDAGTMSWYYDRDAKRTRGELIGKVFASANGCAFVRVTWTYGDGTTSVSESGRTCDRGTRSVDLDSLSTRDALRASVVVRAGGILASESSYGNMSPSDSTKLEDGTLSDGTCNQLDLDTLVAANASATLFGGTAKYFCAGETLRVRLQGTLNWHDTMAGDRARLEVRWVFSGNALSTAPTVSALVNQSTPSRSIDLTSPASSDVIGVCIRVASAPNSSTTFTQQAARCTKLGHVF